jgi:hypothetical protein
VAERIGRGNQGHYLDASGILARTAERRVVQRLDYRAATGDLQEACVRLGLRSSATSRSFDRRTGRLIAEYLATSYRGDDALSWAIPGRSTDKLQKVRAEIAIGAPDDLPW